jgi:hypothetical protein
MKTNKMILNIQYDDDDDDDDDDEEIDSCERRLFLFHLITTISSKKTESLSQLKN